MEASSEMARALTVTTYSLRRKQPLGAAQSRDVLEKQGGARLGALRDRTAPEARPTSRVFRSLR